MRSESVDGLLDGASARGRFTTRASLREPSLDGMRFLNEVIERYPNAVSFGPGRPSERFFQVHERLRGIDDYALHLAQDSGRSPAEVLNDLGQYGCTQGRIRTLVAQYAGNDWGIETVPDAILMTHGTQEAMAVLMLGLFEPGQDVLLVSDPAYIGITGLAAMIGVDIEPVPQGPSGLEAASVQYAIRSVRARGKVPRAIYDVPTYNNPLGTTVPVQARHEILAVANAEHLLVFEDAAYSAFAYESKPPPALKALPDGDSVIYLGTFAKTLFPGARIGFLIADQRTTRGAWMASELAKVKSLLSVNTSPLMEALVGNVLHANDCSLASIAKPIAAAYRSNRDRLLLELRRNFAKGSGVSWNAPAGGFFVRIDVPFLFGSSEVEACARDFGVIVSPMEMFSLRSDRSHQIRLAFSNLEESDIVPGVARLAQFVHDRSAAASRS